MARFAFIVAVLVASFGLSFSAPIFFFPIPTVGNGAVQLGDGTAAEGTFVTDVFGGGALGVGAANFRSGGAVGVAAGTGVNSATAIAAPGQAVGSALNGGPFLLAASPDA